MRSVFLRLPRFFQFGDLLVGDVEEFELGQGAVEQRAVRAGRVVAPELVASQIFGLRAVKFRRINFEQRIAADSPAGRWHRRKVSQSSP